MEIKHWVLLIINLVISLVMIWHVFVVFANQHIPILVLNSYQINISTNTPPGKPTSLPVFVFSHSCEEMCFYIVPFPIMTQ